MLNIGFIGFGEAASQISLGLSSHPNVKVIAYDILLNDEKFKPILEEKALSCSASCIDSLAKLASSSEIIFSAVTSSVAYKVADAIKPHLNSGHIYVDLNAITPEVSKKIASIIEKTGAVYVDGAMVGSLKAHKHKVPILLSGRDVEALTNKIGPLGFNTSFVGEEPGTASGNKLIRSVFTKGLAALLIETLICAKKLGYYDVVLNSMISTLKADPADLINRLISGTMEHSQRRIGELSGSKQMLQEASLDSKMIEATIEVLKGVDSLEFDKKNIPGEIDSSIDMLSSYFPNQQVSEANK